jgi:hypothetical protein
MGWLATTWSVEKTHESSGHQTRRLVLVLELMPSELPGPSWDVELRLRVFDALAGQSDAAKMVALRNQFSPASEAHLRTRLLYANCGV